jgi:hypothetical protein
MFQDASLENAQNRVILAHELTHALQDQNFGLLKLPLEVRDNDDQAEAASALIEGDATLVMSQYMAKDLTWRTLTDTVSYSATQSMEQIRKAPHYLREMLVFPYLQGQQFCAAVFARGGFPAVSAVYADPPSSTAQILHPEKYFPESRENPIPVTFADRIVDGQKPLDDNLLGEMGCRILFSMSSDPESADQVAAGWRGDRYLVYDHGNELVWKTEWRGPQAAAGAIAAFQSVCDRRFKISGTLSGAGATESDSWPPLASTPPHFLNAIHTSPTEVVFTLATSKQSSDTLSQKFTTGSPR